jgi:ParB-like chromosome segregation protein Spo0J
MTKHLYRNHEVADFFPAMTEREFAELKTSIQQQGQIQAIVVDGDVLLDGRHRLRACRELGIEPVVVQFSTLGLETTPAAWILTTNAERRNLTPDQKIAVMSAYNHWEQQAQAQPGDGRNPSSGEGDDRPQPAASGEAEFPGRNQPGKSPVKRRRGRPAGSGTGRQRERLAKAADQTQYRARLMLKLRKHMPELAAEVEAGRLSLKEASRRLNERYRKQQSEAAPSTSAEQDAENGGELAPMPLAYAVSIVSILMSIDIIAEFTDTAPGKEQRQHKIAELVREFQSLAG